MASLPLHHFDYQAEILQSAARNWYLRSGPRRRNDQELKAGRLENVESMQRVAANEAYQRAAAQRDLQDEMLPAPPDVLNSLLQERIVGGGGFLDVSFLELGMAVARFVGRIQVRLQPNTTLGFGTGFMASPRLLLTNHHVLSDAGAARYSEVQFDYQKDRFGRPLPMVTCRLDPDSFFLTNQALDFTLVAVSDKSVDGLTPLQNYAWLRLRPQSGKALIGDSLNIIQHPQGEMKQLVVRQNKLIDTFGNFVQYQTDTQPGSSGSPVLSDSWDVVALHHSGVPKTDKNGNLLSVDGKVWVPGRDDPARLDWVGNEGIRVSSLVEAIQAADVGGDRAELKRQLLEVEPPTPMEIARMAVQPTPKPDGGAASSGTISFTIPLRVTVSLGDPCSATAIAGPGAQPPPAPLPPTPTAPTGLSVAPSPRPPEPGGGPATAAAALMATLAAAKHEFEGRDDVLRVDLGYAFDDSGWITDKRAIVVTRRPQSGYLRTEPANASQTPLPDQFQGLAVQVVVPSIADLVALARGPQMAEAAFNPPVVGVDEITYQPPSGASLEEVVDEMHVIAHVSPDAGWSQLEPFLKATKQRLVVGMFDFGAPHIEAAVESLSKKASFEDLTLVMQRGESLDEGVKADDYTDAQTVDRLADAFKRKNFEQAWVKIGRVNGWVAYSYHIKLAVRDEKAFWVSSGNWQSSNQPPDNPLDDPTNREYLDKYNREWHAIVEHGDLARTLQSYLENDYQHNSTASGQEELALPDIFWPRDLFIPSPAEAAPAFKYFEPFDETRTFKVRPLLTPDESSYHKYVLELVQSAENELLFQNQTFNAPRDQDDSLRELVDAVLKKQQDGVDVRIVFRLFDRTATRRNLDALKQYGFDMSKIKVQSNCHTKGIVVDRKRILLGSQNWSNAGVSTNRDASLLFDDEALAKYFAEIFEHDWTVLATQSIGTSGRAIELAPAQAKTPAGMERLTWKDYMEMH